MSDVIVGKKVKCEVKIKGYKFHENLIPQLEEMIQDVLTQMMRLTIVEEFETKHDRDNSWRAAGCEIAQARALPEITKFEVTIK